MDGQHCAPGDSGRENSLANVFIIFTYRNIFNDTAACHDSWNRSGGDGARRLECIRLAVTTARQIQADLSFRRNDKLDFNERAHDAQEAGAAGWSVTDNVNVEIFFLNVEMVGKIIL